MLWDMIRYRNFDTTSPYNRMAAEWAKTQRQFILPLDQRPLRDRPILSSVTPTAPAPFPQVPPAVPSAASAMGQTDSTGAAGSSHHPGTAPPEITADSSAAGSTDLGMVELEPIQNPDLIPADFIEVIDNPITPEVPTGRLVTPPVPPSVPPNQRPSNETPSSSPQDDSGITFL